MKSLTTLDSMNSIDLQKLEAIGITTPEALLDEGSSPQGRKAIAQTTGIDSNQILRWVNHVDLFRIKGVAGEYADLLEAAGVDTIPELAQRKPENLYQRLAAINEEKQLVRLMPTPSLVANWVEQAKQLPRKVVYS
ncbi:MAG: DUF4332 domain-containing protein [Leptolyngbyaceae cyanobacterium SL_7_1]|nr:DUF4332 domain-containing protein [Leptolyngbyaceae cyanobacterium SL_7_1]